MPANFYPGQTDYLRKLNDLALAKDVADIPRNAAAAAASAAAAGQAATSASADAVKASAQAASASAAFASLDARYLGAKALAPTSDNAGAALLAGATYWDTVLNGGCLRVFQAGTWMTIPTNVASQVASTPAGGIVATNVQAALAELDTKKAVRATTLAGYGITDAQPSSYVPAWGSITGKPQFAAVATSGSKVDVGLGSVDNTADMDKPVSITQRAALDLKASQNGDVTQDFKLASINGSFISGMQNRVINGDMRINQRGVPNSGTYLIGYGLDRWNYDASVAGKVAYGPNFYNVATRAPGFPNYLGLGAQGAYSASAIEAYLLQQVIEGNHLADLQYGTASAKTCTLSAWVYSNIAGSHSGALYNILANKSYVFSFSVPVANTWTKIAVSIPGDLASAMNTNNMQGLHLRFNLGSGANFVRPVTGTWITGNMTGVAGAVNMLANNGNFLITGVQFEVGTATPFSRRSMAEEMSLCIRYYCNSFPEGADVTVLAADALGLILSGGEAVDSLENNGRHTVKFPIPMRATPTINMRGYVGNPYSWACQGTAAQGGVQGFLGQAGEITNKYMKVKSNTSARQYNIQGNWEAIAEI
ncbi:hypothetical protein [Janthinobacterium sp. FW305-128]|uniref:hypothetical protein n=1 Tax=Janthinobacterium sp. FW305-128 TaxID=2775055 RepID=UPI001E64DFC8|nr:hypothetical protein [Janthinobacterium sp. FW305-128]MCC7681864.1 hypothetical protein [Janthinobacterium sp. FW305-128]